MSATDTNTKSPTRPLIPDVLAERYVSPAMLDIWSAEHKIVLERKLWVAVLNAQRNLGLDIPEEAVKAYATVIPIVDLGAIAARELTLKHDVKARIAEFNDLASRLLGGGKQVEYVHEGFTSRDLTDNIEQLQVRQSLVLVRDRTVALLRRLDARAREFAFLDMCGRSHNIPGQTITLGKRFANYAEELLEAFERLEQLLADYPLRGMKGAMGTQQDMAELLGNRERALVLEETVREFLGFPRLLSSVGQVYPRSLDFAVVSTLAQLASAPANFAKNLRIMGGHELIYEGFGGSQTGSTAMPHKMNNRTCERICGLLSVLNGYLDMTSRLLGDQWGEGDVSCSVVRRVALPGSFFALDGLYESAMTVLDELSVFPGMIEAELRHYLPFLSTTRLLVAAVKAGLGRETAHQIIKEHATRAIKSIRSGAPNTFVEYLAHDPRFPIERSQIEILLKDPQHGAAAEQVAEVHKKTQAILMKHSEAAEYTPVPIR